MNNWSPNEIRRLRGHILLMLASRHRNQRFQQHRFHDVGLTRALQNIAVEASVYDVVTCLQDLGDRDWVKFRSQYNELSNRTELDQIEIRPEGRDIVEQTKSHPAIDFGRG